MDTRCIVVRVEVEFSRSNVRPLVHWFRGGVSLRAFNVSANVPQNFLRGASAAIPVSRDRPRRLAPVAAPSLRGNQTIILPGGNTPLELIFFTENRAAPVVFAPICCCKRATTLQKACRMRAPAVHVLHFPGDHAARAVDERRPSRKTWCGLPRSGSGDGEATNFFFRRIGGLAAASGL